MRSRALRWILPLPVAALALLQALPAAACGGLIAPNGAIRLTRATTLVDWHDGVEHYMTSFTYEGTGFDNFGWIVPLPAVPDKVEEGGGWTLQRLDREVHPPKLFELQGAASLAAPLAPAPAEVLQTAKVRALDITVLRGSGDSIVEWCKQNNFFLSPETKAHLLVYAQGSPIFMAAKYNVARAQATRQTTGDGAPVLITMHIPHLWVPLEVLANGASEVNADIYLLTQDRVYVTDLAAILGEPAEGSAIPKAPGLSVAYQQPVSAQLFRDLSSDKNMGWVKPGGILTYLTLNAPAEVVTYDMGISSGNVIHVASYGTYPMDTAVGLASSYRPAPYDDGVERPAPGLRTALEIVGLLVAFGAAVWFRVAVLSPKA